MAKSWLLVSVLVQTMLAFLVWPNPLLWQPNPISALFLFLDLIPFFWIMLSLQGKKTFFWTGLSGLAIFYPACLVLTRMPYHQLATRSLFVILGLIGFVILGSIGWLGSYLSRRFPRSIPLTLPALFVTFDFLRTMLSAYIWFIPIPSILLPCPLTGILPLIQMASFTGVYGPEFMLIFVSAMSAWILRAGLSRWPKLCESLDMQNIRPLPASAYTRTMFLAGGIGAVILFLILAGNGEARRIAREQNTATRILKPALLQMNFDPYRAGLVDESVRQNALRFSRIFIREAAQKGAELVVFGEGALPLRFPVDKRFWDFFRTLMPETHLSAIAGAITTVDEKHVYNLWLLIDPQGLIQSTYRKQFLSPFGEYLPWRPAFNFTLEVIKVLFHRTYMFFKLTAVEANDYDLQPGHEEKLFSLGDRKISVKVCDELLYAKYFRRAVRLGAEVFLSPAAGNWFPTPEYYYYYLQIACYRAVETRRWLGRVVNCNGAYYIDALGMVRAITAFQMRDVLVYPMPLLKGKTFYATYGDVFAWICLLVVLVFIVGSLVKPQPPKPSSAPPSSQAG